MSGYRRCTYLYLNQQVRKDTCLNCAYNFIKLGKYDEGKNHKIANDTVIEMDMKAGEEFKIHVEELLDIENPTPEKIKETNAITVTKATLHILDRLNGQFSIHNIAKTALEMNPAQSILPLWAFVVEAGGVELPSHPCQVM